MVEEREDSLLVNNQKKILLLFNLCLEDKKTKTSY